MKLCALLLTTYLFIGDSLLLSAQQPALILSDKAGWHKIAETTVDFKKERDEIAVLGADRFASIKFRVTDAPIEIHNLTIYFEDGGMQDVTIWITIKNPGDESRVIDLKNSGEPALKKVTFTYNTLPNRKDEKARVELWGLKINAEAK